MQTFDLPETGDEDGLLEVELVGVTPTEIAESAVEAAAAGAAVAHIHVRDTRTGKPTMELQL